MAAQPIPPNISYLQSLDYLDPRMRFLSFFAQQRAYNARPAAFHQDIATVWQRMIETGNLYQRLRPGLCISFIYGRPCSLECLNIHNIALFEALRRLQSTAPPSPEGAPRRAAALPPPIPQPGERSPSSPAPASPYVSEEEEGAEPPPFRLDATPEPARPYDPLAPKPLEIIDDNILRKFCPE